MKMYIMRHGETTGDVEGRFGGAYDDALSEDGVAQARGLADELRDRLREDGIERILASDLVRAQQTAAFLGSALGIDVDTEPRWRERDQYAGLSGMVKAEARREHPELVEKLKDRLFTAPGAESYADFAARIAAVFDDVVAAGKPAVLVGHGGCLRVVFRDILRMGELTEIGDCCWVELIREEAGWRVGGSRRIGFGFNQEV